MKKISYLINWAICKDLKLDNEDELQNHYLEGDVNFHPEFSEGQHIESSIILKIDWKRRVIETYDYIYYLEGDPREDYATYLENNLVNHWD